MANCATPKSKFLSNTDRQEILDEHQGMFIKGLDFTQQRAIAESIANELYRNSLSDNKLSSNDITSNIISHIDKEIQNYNESITTLELLEDEDGILSVREQIERLNNVKSNIDKLVDQANTILNTLNSVVVKSDTNKEEDDSDDTVDTSPEAEGQLERNNHSNNFYLELNTRDTLSAKVKKFLAFVEKRNYEDGKIVPVTNVIGLKEFNDFEYVFNELHRVLAGVKASKDDVINRLQKESDEAKESSNKNLVWLEDFIKYFKEAPEDVQSQFVSEMNKHKINMTYVSYNTVNKKDKNGNSYKEFQLFINEDDSGSTSNRILQNWKKEHYNSNVVQEGKYSNIELSNLKARLESIRKPPVDIENKRAYQATMFGNLMSSLGINLHPKYINSLFFGGKTVRLHNDKKGKAWFDLISKGGILDRLLTDASNYAGDVENFEFTDDSLIKALAHGNAKFDDRDFSNSFRVGDKSIYTYSMNQYLKNRTRDLRSDDPFLREELTKTIFTQDSLYLAQLNNPEEDFKDWFEIDYLSLQPLKVQQGRRSDSVTEMSPLDYEVTKYGHYMSRTSFDDIEVNGTDYKVRKATYFFPTNSDKSRVMTMKGLAFEATDSNKFTQQSLELFYNFIVLPEIKRIYQTNSKEFKEKANLKTFNGGIFYLLPSLNDLVFENGESILNVARNTDTLTENQKLEVYTKIKEALNSLTDEKIDKWKEVGIIEKDVLLHLPQVQTSKSTKENRKYYSTRELAMNEVFNYALANANMFQLVIGDPAQYNKGGKTIADEIKNTYDNLTKRLAAEIAPGIEMEGPDYLQVFIDELQSDSTSYDYLKELIGEEAASQYLNMKEADAQEYTTWKEHLDILKSLGKITNEEYNEAFKAFKDGKEPSKEVFYKVLQPLKPVYVWNEIINVPGSTPTYYDRKMYIKSSSFPLIPTLTKGLQIDRFRVAMEALENSTTKNPEGLGVRAAVASAVKVGMPIKSLKLTKDKQGNFVDNIDLEGTYIRLKRKGFRIQQDIPYDENVSEVNDGTQQKKLLFTNYSNPRLEAEYNDTYRKLYELNLSEFRERLLNKYGEIDNSKIAEILVEELKGRGETSKPLYDGLKVLDNKFSIPLWLSPYADTYMSLLNSVVKKIISHKLKGKSFVLGSKAGFKPDIIEGEEAVDWIEKNKTGIVFTDSYDPTKGLQIQRDENGTIKGAQVLIPFKFRDNEGKLLKLKEFLVPGTNKLDYQKLPKDILEAFGFRIPTQLHASMSYIEIVGFLPKVNGDLIIAPAEFTTQMGSDFDVDKLYTYMYQTAYDKETKTLTKAELIEDYDYLKTLVDPKELKLLKKRYKAGLHNKLLDIHLEVMKDKALQANVHLPLGFGLYDSMIKEMEQYVSKPIISILSDQYQENKFYDGVSGKGGVGLFSSDSIFNALAQNKNLTLTQGLDSDGNIIGIKVEFGNTYNPVYSTDREGNTIDNLSKVKSQKKENPRYKTEVIAAAQNLSVDNANKQGMHVVNMNKYTFGVYSILNFLGFEEDISAPFMSQPIIRDYVRLMKNSNSILTEYSPNKEKEIVEELKKKYSNDKYIAEEHSKLADFRGEDASKAMLSMLKDREKYKNFGLYQASILDKFMYLKNIERPIGPIKQLLNLDSKGFSKNMYINKRRLNVLYNSENSKVLNVVNLFGVQEGDTIIPTTTVGYDNIYGNKTLVNSFGEQFLESNPAMEFNNIVTTVEAIKGDEKQLSEAALVKLKNEYKNYLTSNIRVNNIDDVRKDLFLNKSKGSFYDRLTKFKNTIYGKENRFLNKLTVVFDKVVEIDYNNSGGDSFDETATYKSFIDLFNDSNDRNGIVPSDLAEELIVYSLLRGGNKAQQFLKFIPISALNKILDIPQQGNTDIFVDQWIRHNPKEAVLIDKSKVVTVKGSNQIKLTIPASKYIRIQISEKEYGLYRMVPDSNNYERVNTLGKSNTTEYTPYDKTNSIIQTNNVVKINNPKVNINPLSGRENIQSSIVDENITGSKVNSVVTTDELNFNSLHDLLASITNISLDGYSDQVKLAKVLLENIDPNTKLTNDNTINSMHMVDNNTININTDLKSGKDLITTILHETLHSLSNKFIFDFINNKQIPVEIHQALTRLNGYKNQVIDSIKDKDSFDLFFVRLFNKYISENKIDKVKNILSNKTIHARIRELANEALLRQDQIAKKQNITNERYDSLSKSDKVLTNNQGYFYYSLLNLNEFVAVAGSQPNIREHLITITGNKYAEGIKNLFEKILEFLGIAKDESAKFLNDIFTVSNIKEEIIEKPKVEKQVEPVQQVNKEDSLEDLHLTALEEEGRQLQEKCKGSTFKAEKGMRSNFTGGSEWNLVSDLKGNTHEQGGIDVFIEGSNIKYAKYGMYVKSNLNEEDLIVQENKSNFTVPLYSGGWEIVKDLKGATHAEGGINLEVINGNVHFAKGESKIHAKCGCLIRHTPKVETEVAVKTRIKKNK
jgi:hypothetical protein